MPTQCRPWRHKLIKVAFSGKLWKGQNDARFGPFETKIGSLKSSSRDLSNGTLQNLGMFGDGETLEGSK